MAPMSSHLGTIPLPPKIPSDREQPQLLAATGQRRGALRDHILRSLALGTGLREHELVALDFGEIMDSEGKVRRRVELRVFKRCCQDAGPQQVLLSESLRARLARYIDHKRRTGQSVGADAPLFVSRGNRRLSLRQLRHLSAVWQERAGFERRFSLHALRHAACTNMRCRPLVREVSSLRERCGSRGLSSHGIGL